MQSQFHKRFDGLRWQLLGSTILGTEGLATIEIQKALQRFLPYVLPVGVSDAANLEQSTGHVAIVGTSAHPRIRELISEGTIQAPDGAEGFSIFLGASPWNEEARLLVVAGSDPVGALYGSQEVAARLSLEGHLLDGFSSRRHWLESWEGFSATEKPAMDRRGIWTWGCAIYRFRSFVDQMAKLKLNTLVIWNDQVPLNAAEVIDYAHLKGVRVILGFHCGWGHANSVDISKASDRAAIVRNVRSTYEEQYAHLPHDGVYFQTLTEHSDRNLAGASTASWVCQIINDTAEALLGSYPDLRMEFGVHGTSIGEDDVELRAVDSRVELVWEDCGSMPYAYFADQIENVDHALAWSKRLAELRPDREFAMVAKGWMQLRWEQDFENHEDFILGEQSVDWIRKRLVARESEWEKINHHWYRNYPLAASFYRELSRLNVKMTVTGLIEDGLLEEKIQPSVALFAETLWNPWQSDADLLARATRPFLNQ